MAKLPSLWEIKPIEYLVQEAHPEIVAFVSVTNRKLFPEQQERYEQAERQAAELRAELQKKSPTEIAALVVQARQREKRKHEKYQATKDATRFFSLPDASADFEYWAKISFWTIDEAVALSFGKNPKIVNWERIYPHTNLSPFANEYAAKRELALRAKASKQIYETTAPSTFIAWANRTQFELPQELETAVKALGIPIADWKTLFDQAIALNQDLKDQNLAGRKEFNDLAENHSVQMTKFGDGRDKLVQGYSEMLEKQSSLIGELNKELGQLKTANPKKLATDLSARERDSLLKLVIGMAVQGYRYDPKLPRSPIIPEIQADLEKSGVPLDDETIRKYLRQAAELLPGDVGD